MRLSSVYLYEKIKEKYEILKKGNLSGNDGYLRPFLRCGINRDDRKKEDRFRSGHVYVIQVRDDEEWERVVPVMKDIFWIFCKKSDSEKQNDNMIVGAGTGIGTGTEVEAGAPESFETDINRNEVEVAVSSCDDSDFGNIPYIQVALENLEEIAEFMNDMQEIFDTADGWERKIHDLMLEHAGMERLLQVTSEFLQNPLTVIGLDFTFVAEAGSKYLPPRARLYTDEGLNVEYVNALLQNETYREMADTHETVMFPAYISGCRSMNRNLFVDGKATHRLVLTECRSEITLRVICVLDILVENENGIFDGKTLRSFKMLYRRTERRFQNVLNLREYVTQVRESYEAEGDISLNTTMKIFTVVTTIFLPLTLIVGWYGMNLKMPEYGWKYGYLFVGLLSVACIVGIIIFFKRK